MSESWLIRALMAELPKEDDPFPAEQREAWLRAMAVNLELIYPSPPADVS